MTASVGKRPPDPGVTVESGDNYVRAGWTGPVVAAGKERMLKRKVLIIVENLPVPFDTRVWKEARSLYENGYSVSVLSPRGKKYTKTYEYLDGIHIYRHPRPSEGNTPLGFVLEFGCALFWEFLFSWWIYFRRGFDVIQGCNPPDDIFAVAVPFKVLGVSYIFDHHDASPELYLSKYERKDFLHQAQLWMERMTYRCADVVMATNNSYRDLAVARGHCDPADVFVVRNGPDLDTFKAVPPDSSLKYGKRYLVGYVGNMSVQEGLDILLDVALHVKKSGRTDIHFTCIGGGPGLPQLREMASDKKLDDVIDFTGRVSDQQLLTLLSTADICVNPDKPCEMNNISTMIKIMEYMALAKPIVQFDLKEGRYSAGDASVYAANHRVDDFAWKLVWLLDHPEERTRMGTFGRERVERELAWKFSVNSLLAAYERAYTKRGAISA